MHTTRHSFKKSAPIGVVSLLICIAALSGCNGFALNLNSDPNTSLLNNNTPIIEEITWIDMSAEELIANYEQYIGKEVYVRNTVIVSKSKPYVMVGGGAIRAELKDADYVNYLAVTDTVEVRGIVAGLDEDGAILIPNAHMNVQFSCFPRLHAGNDIGNDYPVTTGDNEIASEGIGQNS
ncbi:hypothetical protein DGWBC_1143 [Dehalogenimonas sp. WBC-2]|nr:hypothetical protein DGWBC_1143 [Dehalogenimonas sp. WBC-2]